jgi:hypothetical protein
MQPIVKDTKKDVARPAHPDTHAKSVPTMARTIGSTELLAK